MPRARTLLILTVVYLAACRVMLAPLFNFSAPASATFGGDARLILWTLAVGSSRVDLQACKLEYSIVSPK